MNNKSFNSDGREKFGSRLGFILISAGCAIGLGNVWRFPYIVGKYGGAAFILLYLLFLVIFGLPIMTMEFAVGRASGKSIADSFRVLEPKGTKWHWFGWVGMLGNYMLMMFYTTITGWMGIYLVKMLKGDFVGVDEPLISQQFAAMKGNPLLLVGAMVLVTAVGFLICSFGLKKGVEKITKFMMLALLTIIVVLAVYVMTIPGSGKGYQYYLIPDFTKLFYNDGGKFIFGEVVFAAIGQAFFTLSIGMGSMAIFGSHISKERRLLGEATTIAALDTGVAFVAGLIVIPACFAFGVDQKAGTGLIFKALPAVFNSMGPVGCIVWGSLFFVFMLFAALSTVVAVFENIISFGCELWGWSRKKSCLINFGLMIVLALPCVFGFNILSGFAPLGFDANGVASNIMDLEDFIISKNILPLGSLVYVLFCVLDKKAWGWNQLLTEANTGKGLKLPKALKFYCKWILPILLIVLWAQGIITTFVTF